LVRATAGSGNQGAREATTGGHSQGRESSRVIKLPLAVHECVVRLAADDWATMAA